MPTPTFPRSGLQFLRTLEKNNTTAWFHAHKDEYRATVTEPALAIVAHINDELRKFAPDYVNAKKAPLSRPNRDTRFSKDKSPYRTDVGVVFPRGGKEKHEVAGFFFRIAADGAELVAGTFMPGPDELRKLRAHLAKNHAAFEKLVRAKAISRLWGELEGEQLKRVPKPYDADHPAESLLRRNQLFLRRSIPASAVTATGFAADIVKSFRAATPFVEELDSVLQ